MEVRRNGRLVCLILLAVLAPGLRAEKLVRPARGLYLGAFPDLPEVPAPVWGERIATFEKLVGKKLAWATIMNDFADGPTFPTEAVNQVLARGTVPFVRLLPRSKRVQGEGPEPLYRLDLIANGKFDRELRRWCEVARGIRSPLLVEFAQEPNGDWYGWGAAWNGAGAKTLSKTVPDGPWRYQLAYRHFVDLCRATGARNITWFFHLDAQPKPHKYWNQMAYYYPGDEYVDWVGLSVYGAQYPTDFWATFNETIEPAYRELSAITTTKPMAVLEFGVIEKPGDAEAKGIWLRDALISLMTRQYPRIHAVNYWHESSWIPSGQNNFRIDSSPQALRNFRLYVQQPEFVPQGVFKDK